VLVSLLAPPQVAIALRLAQLFKLIDVIIFEPLSFFFFCGLSIHIIEVQLDGVELPPVLLAEHFELKEVDLVIPVLIEVVEYLFYDVKGYFYPKVLDPLGELVQG